MLAAFSCGFFLLHPGVLGDVDSRRAEPVRLAVGIHGVSSTRWRLLGAERRPVRHVAGEVRQGCHELRHGGLAVDEACFVAAVHGNRGGCRDRRKPKSSPGAGPRPSHHIRRRRPRLHRHEIVPVQVATRRHSDQVLYSHEIYTTAGFCCPSAAFVGTTTRFIEVHTPQVFK